MDARMQKQRMMRWVGWLLAVFSTVGSWSASAESIPVLYTYNGNNTAATPKAACEQAGSIGGYRVFWKNTGEQFTDCPIQGPYYPYLTSGADLGGECLQWIDNCDVRHLRPLPMQYAITLSGDTTVEPWNKVTDSNHTTANLTYAATVKDASGRAVPNVEVTITTEVAENSGGHIHNSERPKGKLATLSDPIKEGKETIAGNTDINGVYSFTFGSEEASGTHTLTAKCTGCQASVTTPVDVKVGGLQPIPATPFLYSLQLPNRDTNHPATFYLTKASIEKLRIVALYYYAATFKKKKKGVIPDFVLNDASLEWGGVLDCYLTCNSAMYPSAPWHKHHIEHRRGSVVDVKANGSPGAIVYDRDFRYWATYLGVDVGNLHGSVSGLHYHLRLNNGAKE